MIYDDQNSTLKFPGGELKNIQNILLHESSKESTTWKGIKKSGVISSNKCNNADNKDELLSSEDSTSWFIQWMYQSVNKDELLSSEDSSSWVIQRMYQCCQ